jgi:hypothetical protein
VALPVPLIFPKVDRSQHRSPEGIAARSVNHATTFMRTSAESDEQTLRHLVRQARPSGALPPDFAAAVWRRIEQSQATTDRRWQHWLTEAAAFLCEPRHALATLGAVLFLGALTGLIQGWQQSEDLARQRYLTAVRPLLP